MAAAVMTNPHHFVKTERIDKDVRFNTEEVIRDCEPTLRERKCEEKSFELNCEEKCSELGYMDSICKSFPVTLEGNKEKEEFEGDVLVDALNVGETSDCYVPICPRPITGLRKICYCLKY